MTQQSYSFAVVAHDAAGQSTPAFAVSFEIHYANNHTFNFNGANGTSSYTIAGISDDSNPDLYVKRGNTHTFQNNAGASHPLRLKSGGNDLANFNDGNALTNGNSKSFTFNKMMGTLLICIGFYIIQK